MQARDISRISAQEAHDQSQNHESNGNPLGSLGQLGVHALGLVLGQESVGTAADGTGQAGTLAGLQDDNGNQSQRNDKVNDRNNNLSNGHDKIQSFRYH